MLRSRFFLSSIPLAFLSSLLLGQGASLAEEGDAVQGKTYFAQNCALCHADTSGAGNAAVAKEGPSLVGVLGRRAGTTKFSYSSALQNSGLTWDRATLDHFLTDPTAAVPGTTMPLAVRDAKERQNVIAYLATLKFAAPAAASATASPAQPATGTGKTKFTASDWNNAAPGVSHHIMADDLPAPFATVSVGNAPKVAPRPANATLSVPPGFKVESFASGLSNPRIIRIAPNGDIFVAETAANRIHVMRAADGATAPQKNQVFLEGLDRPFGIAFYPPGPLPQWIYIANNNSVVRLPYHTGDLLARGDPQVIVPHLTDSHGGHSTRDIAFSPDGRRLFISVGSGSNVAETMSPKSPADAQAWDAEHGLGSTWGDETNRADVLVTDPEGHTPLRVFASGIRNGVGLAVNPTTGDLWTSTNERDGLGDDLVPDYITRVKEGGFYGWPWYYIGNHEDPRLAGQRPDLAGKAIVPDVLLQSHSASLEMCFYTATGGPAAFPAEYQGDIFAAEHGSWNRSIRTGYKIIRVRRSHGAPTGEYDDFVTGFVIDNDSVWGRPVGVATAHDGALLFSDDGGGIIWRVSYMK